MTRASVLLATSLILMVAAPSLFQRWKQESQDRRLLIAADWSEVRDLGSREARSVSEWLDRLKKAGASAMVVTPLTLGEMAAASGQDPDSRLLHNDHRLGLAPTAAIQALRELQRRGVNDLAAKAGSPDLLMRQAHPFHELQDIEVGYDADLLRAVREAGLVTVCRVNRDPWMSEQAVRGLLEAGGLNGCAALIFNSDEIPGGASGEEVWRTWLAARQIPMLLFEFRPTKSAWLLAHDLPELTYRAHTISPAEVKDLPEDQERSRWRRAAEERACRYLLVHPAVNEGTADLLSRVQRLRDDLSQRGWRYAMPWPHWGWKQPGALVALLRAALGFLIAAITPGLALAWGLQSLRRSGITAEQAAWRAWTRTGVAALIGGSLAAAAAQTPETMLQILPFRGTKLAFVAAWLSGIFVLFRWNELADWARQPLRRWDLILGALILAGLIYVMIRSGNAPASLKHPFEQVFRDRLEDILRVRPRFKEFAFGHPLLLLGYWLAARGRAPSWNARCLLLLGMAAPISIVNTFCHLHSPLALAYGRSLLGMTIGLALGWVVIKLWPYQEKGT